MIPPDTDINELINDHTKTPSLQEGAIAPEMIIDTPGKEPINLKRWELAQIAEREQHTMSHAEGLLHYGKAYQNVFKMVGLGNDLHGLNVIEIGPADFPALQTCINFNGVIIEPMPSPYLEQICKEKGITLVREPFETVGISTDLLLREKGMIEIWLFNVMQHVIYPNQFILRAKQIADRIRYFEPIDQPITTYHPHTYSLKDYQEWFGDRNNVVNLYVGGSIPGFHTADCAYGCWIK